MVTAVSAPGRAGLPATAREGKAGKRDFLYSFSLKPFRTSVNYKAHLLIGLSANALAFALAAGLHLFSLNAVAANPVLVAGIILAAVVFSILPDIDSSKSVASWIFRLVLFAATAFFAVDYYLTKNVFSLYKAAGTIFLFALHFAYAQDGKMHRRFPHSLAFGALACLAVFILTGSKLAALAGCVAFLSHLAADGRIFSSLKFFSKPRKFFD